jgi:hypothetical protein
VTCMRYRPCFYPSPMAYCIPVVVAPVTARHTVVHEIDVNTSTTTATALVGGRAPARLTVEYLVESGAVSPSVTVTVVSNGQTTNWTDTNISVGFHVNDHLPVAKPGAKLTLQANAATARLRWCEVVCC